MKIDRENKVVIWNDYATIVIKNGICELLKVQRPDEGKGARDIEFKSRNQMALFINGCQEALAAAEEELGSKVVFP